MSEQPAEFEYSDGIKGMEAVVAQLKLKYDNGTKWISNLGRVTTEREEAMHLGYRNAMWDAMHSLGEAKAREAIEYRRLKREGAVPFEEMVYSQRDLDNAVTAERERIAEAIHIQRFAVRNGDTTIDSYYYGSIRAERIACPSEGGHRDGEWHGGVSARLNPRQQAERNELLERQRIEREQFEAEDRGPSRVGMSQW